MLFANGAQEADERGRVARVHFAQARIEGIGASVTGGADVGALHDGEHVFAAHGVVDAADGAVAADERFADAVEQGELEICGDFGQCHALDLGEKAVCGADVDPGRAAAGFHLGQSVFGDLGPGGVILEAGDESGVAAGGGPFGEA